VKPQQRLVPTDVVTVSMAMISQACFDPLDAAPIAQRIIRWIKAGDYNLSPFISALVSTIR